MIFNIFLYFLMLMLKQIELSLHNKVEHKFMDWVFPLN